MKIRTIYVDEEAWEEFKQFCKNQGLSASALINAFIKNVNSSIKIENKSMNINININIIQQKTIAKNNNRRLVNLLLVKEFEKWLNIASEALEANRPIPPRARENIKKLLPRIELSPEQCETVEKIISV